MLSNKFIRTIKLNNSNAYHIANQAGVHPSTLSQIINGIIQVRDDDERVLRIARVVGLQKDDCFDDQS